MRKTELEKYRRRLMELRARLQGDVDSILEAGLSKQNGTGSGNTPDDADASSENWDTEMALNLSRNDEDTLDLVNSALKRIEQGTYGLCTATGVKIGKDRLDAIPYTPYCVDYAAQIEANGGDVLD